MTVYTASAEAAKQAVLQGLTDDLSVDTLQKLWDHYLGLRSIAETQKESTPLFTNSSYPEYIGGIGDDHISFDLGGESPCFVSTLLISTLTILVLVMISLPLTLRILL